MAIIFADRYLYLLTMLTRYGIDIFALLGVTMPVMTEILLRTYTEDIADL